MHNECDRALCIKYKSTSVVHSMINKWKELPKKQNKKKQRHTHTRIKETKLH